MSAKHKSFGDWFNAATAGLRRAARQRLEIELRAHYEDSVEAATAAGLSAEAAHRQALDQLGDALETRELYKEEYAEAAPWEGEFLPARPSDADYGYVKGSKLVACTREDLIKACKGETFSPSEVALAWGPENARVAPVESIPFLFDAIRESRKKSAHLELFSGAMWGAILFWEYSSGRISNLRHVALMIALAAALPAINGFRNLQTARKLTPEALAAEAAETPAFCLWSGRQTSWISISLIIAFAVLLIMQIVAAGFGAPERAVLDKDAVWRGEWWRLLTAVFLHGGMMHLIFNVTAMGLFGHLVEVGIHRHFVAPVFLASALAGSLFSQFLNPMPSVGASGGILGLAGFLFVTVAKFGDLPSEMVRRWIATGLCFSAGAGILAYDLFDSAAHLGGVLAGLAMGAAIRRPKKIGASKALLTAHLAACAILLAGAIGAIVVMMKGK